MTCRRAACAGIRPGALLLHEQTPIPAPSYRYFARSLAVWCGDAPDTTAAPGGWVDGGSSDSSPAWAETIYALSSGQGRSAVAVVRLTGPRSDDALAALLPKHRELPTPRTLALATLRHPETRDVLDRAMVVRFPAPHSFTGEDCAELHLHGGPAVVRCVLDALGTLRWARPADAGEFSRRAFEAGKLDLTEVEGLADLLRAETEWQRRQALRQSSGAVRRQYEAWRGTLLTCLARVEAVIDFGEDEGIADEVAAGVVPLVLQLRGELERHLAAGSAGELVREGVRVAIVGPPNAGKSSLLNALAGREAAIVSPIPGTTRDTLEVALDLGGYKVFVTDCAGLRGTECPIEAEGVRRALRAVREAQIVLRLQDATELLPSSERERLQLRHPQLAAGFSQEAALEQLLEQAILDGGKGSAGNSGSGSDGSRSSGSRAEGGGSEAGGGGARVVLNVLNKLDALQALYGQEAGLQQRLPPPPPPPQQQHGGPCLISCATGAGLDDLLGRLQAAVAGIVGSGGDPAAAATVARARHRRHIQDCIAALERYEAVALQVEVAAEELRAAAKALGRVTGALDTESVLDSLFSEFCIGK